MAEQLYEERVKAGLMRRIEQLETALREIYDICKKTPEHEMHHAFAVEIPNTVEQAMPDLWQARGTDAFAIWQIAGRV